MPRPTKLTPERQERIINALRAGNYAEIAARYAGIHESTYYEWLRDGRRDIDEDRTTTRKAKFAQAVEEARAIAEVRNVSLVQEAATSHWQAAAWWLERTDPSRWGRRQVEVSGRDGGPIELSHGDARDAVLALLGVEDDAESP